MRMEGQKDDAAAGAAAEGGQGRAEDEDEDDGGQDEEKEDGEEEEGEGEGEEEEDALDDKADEGDEEQGDGGGSPEDGEPAAAAAAAQSSSSSSSPWRVRLPTFSDIARPGRMKLKRKAQDEGDEVEGGYGFAEHQSLEYNELSLEEAFFLQHVLGIMSVSMPDGVSWVKCLCWPGHIFSFN